MKKSQPIKTSAPCEKLLKVIGDYWTLSIIQAIDTHERRFCELERILPTINPVTLTSRLKKLEELQLIERRKECPTKLPVLYSLTKSGLGLVSISQDIQKFADSYVKKLK